MNYTDKLRARANVAINKKELVSSSYDLACKAEVDPANLARFLKGDGGVTFNNGVHILRTIGGSILFPGDAVEMQHDTLESLRAQIVILQETIVQMANRGMR